MIIDLNLDSLGHGPAFVPRQDFVAGKSSFDERLKKISEKLDNLRDLILRAYERKKLDDTSVKSVRNTLQEDLVSADQIQKLIGETLTELAMNESDISSLQVLVDQRRLTLSQQLDDLKKKNSDAGRIKGATTVLSIGAALIPGVGPFVAVGISAVGDVIYNNNAGVSTDPIETLVSIAEKNAKFYASIKGAEAAWQAHKQDLDLAKAVFAGNPPPPEKPGDKPVDRAEATKRAGQSAASFAEKIKEVFDSLQGLPKPTQVTMTTLESEDQELQSLLAQIGDKRQKQANGTEILSGLQRKLEAVTGEQATALSVEADLLAADIQNDRDVMRWKQTGLALWRQQLERLYTDAILLRRSLYFETAKLPNLPEEVYQFPEEMTAYIRSGLYSPDGGGASPQKVTSDYLNTEAKKHTVALQAISTAIDDAFQEYQRERAGGATPYQQTFSFDNSGGFIAKMFLKELNAQLGAAWKQAAFGSEVRAMPLLIPLRLPAPPNDLPERLIKLDIYDVKLKEPAAVSGKTINLDVSYELAGELRRSGVCNYVDMREHGAQSRAVHRFQVNATQTAPDQFIIPLTFEELRRYQTAPLARTPFYITAHVSGDPSDQSWKSVPVIESLSFSIRIVQ